MVKIELLTKRATTVNGRNVFEDEGTIVEVSEDVAERMIRKGRAKAVKPKSKPRTRKKS